MSASGIGLVDSELAEVIESADAPTRRRVVAACCRLALDRTSLSDDRLQAAERALTSGRYGDGLERAEVLRLVEELDEVAWDLQDRVEAGTASQGEYLDAFARARAAAAVGCAFEIDSRGAGLEALYEAYHAVQDLAAMKIATASAIG